MVSMEIWGIESTGLGDMLGSGEADGKIVPEVSMISWAGGGAGHCDGKPSSEDAQ